MAENKNGLGPNQIKVAPGTELERVLTISIPRGRQHRDRHMRVLATFGDLEGLVSGGEVQIKQIVEAIERVFGAEKFEDEMVPFVLGMDDEAGRAYLDELLPLEKFIAYMEAAAIFVGGMQNPAVDMALKK